MGALHINGQKATGLDITFADGVFIDADNVIYVEEINRDTIVSTSYSYTATEDCYIYAGGMTGGGTNDTCDHKIDGAVVNRFGHIDYKSFGGSYLVKKGQIFSMTNIGYWYYIKVYRIQQGTIEGKLQPVIYSTEEREVGVWTDGRPLYQRTIQGTLNVTSTSRNWYEILPVSALPNLDNVVPINGSYIIDSGDGQVYPIPMTTGDNAGAYTSCVYNINEGLRFCVKGVSEGASTYTVTLQYTKTTDQPGSGTWTPDGAYAHHYSTDEKVVGTWIDGKTIYEKTFDLGSDVTIGRNNFSTVTGLQIPNVSMVLDCNGMKSNGTLQGKLLVSLAEYPAIQMQTPRNGADALCQYLTIQYTKTSS